jgi:hypothetical protein
MAADRVKERPGRFSGRTYEISVTSVGVSVEHELDARHTHLAGLERGIA